MRWERVSILIFGLLACITGAGYGGLLIYQHLPIHLIYGNKDATISGLSTVVSVPQSSAENVTPVKPYLIKSDNTRQAVSLDTHVSPTETIIANSASAMNLAESEIEKNQVWENKTDTLPPNGSCFIVFRKIGGEQSVTVIP